jgi:hypothetical protein
MNTSTLRILFLSTMLTSLFFVATSALAATPNLALSLTPAGPGGTTAATVALSDVADIESFTLTMDFSAGNLLTLPASNWFSRGVYLPSRPFGATPPHVELNSITESTARTRVFFDGFKPYSTAKNAAGTVTIQVNPSTQVGAQQPITLTGEYLSKSTNKVIGFSSATTTFTVTNVLTQLLTVKLAGSGTGSVNSVPPGIACTSGTCSASFNKDSKPKLLEAAGTESTFGGWSGGGCSGTAVECIVTMATDQTVTASFTLAQAVRLLTTIPAYYDFLQAAFSAATGSVTIQGRTTTMAENLTTDKMITYTFKGGYNSDFTSQTGATILQGKLTVGKGSLVVDRLIIR